MSLLVGAGNQTEPGSCKSSQCSPSVSNLVCFLGELWYLLLLLTFVSFTHEQQCFCNRKGYLISFVHVLCAHVHRGVHRGVRGQLAGAGAFPLPRGTQGLNLSHQAWGQTRFTHNSHLAYKVIFNVKKADV